MGFEGVDPPVAQGFGRKLVAASNRLMPAQIGDAGRGEQRAALFRADMEAQEDRIDMGMGRPALLAALEPAVHQHRHGLVRTGHRRVAQPLVAIDPQPWRQAEAVEQAIGGDDLDMIANIFGAEPQPGDGRG